MERNALNTVMPTAIALCFADLMDFYEKMQEANQTNLKIAGDQAGINADCAQAGYMAAKGEAANQWIQACVSGAGQIAQGATSFAISAKGESDARQALKAPAETKVNAEPVEIEMKDMAEIQAKGTGGPLDDKPAVTEAEKAKAAKVAKKEADKAQEGRQGNADRISRTYDRYSTIVSSLAGGTSQPVAGYFGNVATQQHGQAQLFSSTQGLSQQAQSSLQTGSDTDRQIAASIADSVRSIIQAGGRV
jgi:hypothetical protein